MQPFLTRFLAVLLTVLPWASAFLALPKVDKPEATLSSPASQGAPQLSNATSTPKTLTSRLTVTKKLYLTYSSLQIEGA